MFKLLLRIATASLVFSYCINATACLMSYDIKEVISGKQFGDCSCDGEYIGRGTHQQCYQEAERLTKIERAQAQAQAQAQANSNYSYFSETHDSIKYSPKKLGSQEAELHWGWAKGIGTPEAYREHLGAYPLYEFADLARIALSEACTVTAGRNRLTGAKAEKYIASCSSK
jgi:hypothetical protein